MPSDAIQYKLCKENNLLLLIVIKVVGGDGGVRWNFKLRGGSGDLLVTVLIKLMSVPKH